MARAQARRRIWIIGASAGIGAALARALAARGTELLLSARDDTALAALAADCGGAGIAPLDLGQPGGLAAICERMRRAPRFDAIICTAAIYEPGRIADLAPDRVEAMVRVNLLGMLEVARLCPPLIRDGGQLVLFGSVAGYLGLPGGQPYSATKAALNNLAESLAVELAPRVDVRLVCPGFVATRLTARNDFAMPFLITAEQAAAEVLRGMARRGFEIHFPRRFTLMMKVLRLLPYGLSLPLLRRLG